MVRANSLSTFECRLSVSTRTPSRQAPWDPCRQGRLRVLFKNAAGRRLRAAGYFIHRVASGKCLGRGGLSRSSQGLLPNRAVANRIAAMRPETSGAYREELRLAVGLAALPPVRSRAKPGKSGTRAAVTGLPH